MAFAADHIQDCIHILITLFLGFCFHHDTDQRLSTGFPDQNPSGVAQFRGRIGNSGLNIR